MDPQAANVLDHIRALAPKVGDKFHTRALCARMDAMTPERLFPLLQQLKSMNLVRYTGTLCVFERTG